MGAVYITISIRYGVLDHVETHAGRKSAFEQAVKIAHSYVNSIGIGTVIEEPDELGDDIPHWIFYQNQNQCHSVIVVFRHIFVPEPQAYIPPKPKTTIHTPKLLDSNDLPFEDNIPAGWDYNGKPVLMSDMKRDPSFVLSVWDLTEEQQKALVIARIRRQPNYQYISVTGSACAFLTQKDALSYLKDWDDEDVKNNIIDNELSLLNEYRDRLLNNM